MRKKGVIDEKKLKIAPKGKTITSESVAAEKLSKDTQFKHGGVNKRGFGPLKKRGDN